MDVGRQLGCGFAVNLCSVVIEFGQAMLEKLDKSSETSGCACFPLHTNELVHDGHHKPRQKS
jgi:hypothetical protein